MRNKVVDSAEIQETVKKVKRMYETQAPFYDRALENSFSISNLIKGKEVRLPKEWADAIKEEAESFVELACPKKGEIALDVACGTGRVLMPLAKKGAICYGVDISPKMIRVLEKKAAENKMKNIRKLEASPMESLNFKDGFFDLVTCMGVMDHYPIAYAMKCLVEMGRVAKNSGRIVIDFPNYESKAAREAYHSWKKDKVGYIYPVMTIRRMIVALGFEIKKVKNAGSMVQFLLKVVKNGQ